MKSWRGLAAVRLAIAVCVAVVASSALARAQPTIQQFHSFQPSTEGSQPYASLIQGSDGNFYGTTQTDGPFYRGTVFKMTPAGIVTVLHAFANSSTNGYNPSTPLIQATDGNFYGTTPTTVFKMTPAGSTTTLHSLDGDDGASISAPLIQAADGSFYGTTSSGGSAFGKGTAFKITSGGTFTVLHVFSGYPLDASAIATPLVQTSDGNFLGVSPWERC